VFCFESYVLIFLFFDRKKKLKVLSNGLFYLYTSTQGKRRKIQINDIRFIRRGPQSIELPLENSNGLF
jgi:hypothetical protein